MAPGTLDGRASRDRHLIDRRNLAVVVVERRIVSYELVRILDAFGERCQRCQIRQGSAKQLARGFLAQLRDSVDLAATNERVLTVKGTQRFGSATSRGKREHLPVRLEVDLAAVDAERRQRAALVLGSVNLRQAVRA